MIATIAPAIAFFFIGRSFHFCFKDSIMMISLVYTDVYTYTAHFVNFDATRAGHQVDNPIKIGCSVSKKCALDPWKDTKPHRLRCQRLRKRS
mgnify:CR=1 FL=1